MYTVEIQWSTIEEMVTGPRLIESLRYSSTLSCYYDAEDNFNFFIERCKSDICTFITLPFEDMKPDICIISLFNEVGELLKMRTIRR